MFTSASPENLTAEERRLKMVARYLEKLAAATRSHRREATVPTRAKRGDRLCVRRGAPRSSPSSAAASSPLVARRPPPVTPPRHRGGGGDTVLLRPSPECRRALESTASRSPIVAMDSSEGGRRTQESEGGRRPHEEEEEGEGGGSGGRRHRWFMDLAANGGSARRPDTVVAVDPWADDASLRLAFEEVRFPFLSEQQPATDRFGVLECGDPTRRCDDDLADPCKKTDSGQLSAALGRLGVRLGVMSHEGEGEGRAGRPPPVVMFSPSPPPHPTEHEAGDVLVRSPPRTLRTATSSAPPGDGEVSSRAGAMAAVASPTMSHRSCEAPPAACPPSYYFEPSERYLGVRAGCCFIDGEMGWGYYADTFSDKVSAERPSADGARPSMSGDLVPLAGILHGDVEDEVAPPSAGSSNDHNNPSAVGLLQGNGMRSTDKARRMDSPPDESAASVTDSLSPRYCVYTPTVVCGAPVDALARVRRCQPATYWPPPPRLLRSSRAADSDGTHLGAGGRSACDRRVDMDNDEEEAGQPCLTAQPPPPFHKGDDDDDNEHRLPRRPSVTAVFESFPSRRKSATVSNAGAPDFLTKAEATAIFDRSGEGPSVANVALRFMVHRRWQRSLTAAQAAFDQSETDPIATRQALERAGTDPEWRVWCRSLEAALTAGADDAASRQDSRSIASFDVESSVTTASPTAETVTQPRAPTTASPRLTVTLIRSLDRATDGEGQTPWSIHHPHHSSPKAMQNSSTPGEIRREEHYRYEPTQALKRSALRSASTHGGDSPPLRQGSRRRGVPTAEMASGGGDDDDGLLPRVVGSGGGGGGDAASFLGSFDGFMELFDPMRVYHRSDHVGAFSLR